MIDVKTAVRAAMDYLHEFKELVPAKGVRLEETEFDDSGVWLITLSTVDEEEQPFQFGIPAIPWLSYKLFLLDAKSGQFNSINFRTLQPIYCVAGHGPGTAHCKIPTQRGLARYQSSRAAGHRPLQPGPNFHF